MRSCILGLFMILCAVGCGDGTVNVSGKVTLDNKPLANATVIFEPDASLKTAGARGITDDKGEYVLSLMNKDTRGAVPGKYKVKITAYDGAIPKEAGANPKMPKQLVPSRYNDNNTELSFDVPSGGSNAANFDLKSK